MNASRIVTKSTTHRMRMAAAIIVALSAASFADATFAQTNADPADYPATHADKKAAKEQAKADKKAAVAQAKADRKKTDAQADADKEKADARVKDTEDQ
jgi:hypothetical protein